MTEDLKNLAAEMRRRGIPPRYFAAQMRRGMSPLEIFAAWPRQTRLDRVGSRRSRRRLVVATYGGWMLVAVLSKLFTPPDSIFPIIPLVPLANAVAGLILLHRRTFLKARCSPGIQGLTSDWSRTETTLVASRFKCSPRRRSSPGRLPPSCCSETRTT